MNMFDVHITIYKNVLSVSLNKKNVSIIISASLTSQDVACSATGRIMTYLCKSKHIAHKASCVI